MKTTTNPAADTAADTLRHSAETFAKGLSSAMDAWLGAWRRSTESMVGAMTGTGCTTPGASAGPWGDMNLESAFGPMRRRSAAVFHGVAELGATSSAEMAAVAADQTRFAARLAERGYESLFGTAAAQSPEALGATTKAMVTDCMENATAMSERLVRIGARGMDRVSELLAVPAAR